MAVSPRRRNPKENGEQMLEDRGLAHIIAINRLLCQVPKLGKFVGKK